jgi:hypothetical protein
MSRGKYSPVCPHANKNYDFKYNAKGEIPSEFISGEYDEETMFANYDSDGYDSYGYSAYDEYKNFDGVGNGVDRNGYTEYDYLDMTDDEFYNC